MPIAMLDEGKPYVIKRVGGKPDTRQFLENLGFIPGNTVTIVTKLGGNVIVRIKESRVAISREMARQIQV